MLSIRPWGLGLLLTVTSASPLCAEAPFDFATQPDFGINAYLPLIVQHASEASYADELETVAHQHLGEPGAREAAKTTGRIRINAAVRARELPTIDAWIARHAPPVAARSLTLPADAASGPSVQP